MGAAKHFPLPCNAADQLHTSASHEAGLSRRRYTFQGKGRENRLSDGSPAGFASSFAKLNVSHGMTQTKTRADNASSSLAVANKGIQDSYTRSLNQQDLKNSALTATSKRHSKRRKARSILRRAKHFAIKHTWVLPLLILLGFLSLYSLDPSESNPIHHFIFLSYRLPQSSPHQAPNYAKGWWDLAFVLFYTVVLSFTREFVMQEILRPLARRAGIRSRGKQARFTEQLYTAIYFGLLGPTGMYVMSRTPVWYFTTRGMYEAFPHRTLDAIFKFYYLFQAAFWAQQAIVLILGMEKPRKDFKELVGHHVVSLASIALSYRFHFTHIGVAVYITHDISDFFLASSKTLNYIDHFSVEPYFFVFMCVWIYLRHYLNLRIIFSLFTEFKTVGPYELDWAAEQYKCPLAFFIALGLLSALQALNLFWLFFIVRIAYRFAVHRRAKDDRSDLEESEVEEVIIKELKKTC